MAADVQAGSPDSDYEQMSIVQMVASHRTAVSCRFGINTKTHRVIPTLSAPLHVQDRVDEDV